MKEHPILFKGEMVRAILAGWKTQTRRLNLKTKYAVGDRLWVKETFQTMAMKPVFRADWTGGDLKWKSSLYMSRKQSRITLEVTAVREERLQDISQEDAIAEGCEYGKKVLLPHASVKVWTHTARDAYRRLWESINGPGSWDENPIVKVITFTMVTS